MKRILAVFLASLTIIAQFKAKEKPDYGEWARVEAVAFSMDGNRAIGMFTDKLGLAIRMWDPKTGMDVKTVRGSKLDWKYRLFRRQVFFSHDAQQFAIMSEKSVQVWDAETAKHFLTIDNPDDVTIVDFSLDGRSLAIGLKNGTTRIWSLGTESRLREHVRVGLPEGQIWPGEIKTIDSKTVGKLTLCWCPPGKLKKAQQGDEAQKEVTFSKGFWIGQQEVSQGLWQKVMGTTPWKGQEKVRSGPKYPAVYVPHTDRAGKHDDAVTFCRKLTELGLEEGWLPKDQEVSLPTEAHWEYACRAGTTTKFSFGEKESDLSQYAWFAENASGVGENYAHEVGTRKPNPWGIYNLHGNVAEWCRDATPRDTYTEAVTLGGTYGSEARQCAPDVRAVNDAGLRFSSSGLRILIGPATVKEKNNLKEPENENGAEQRVEIFLLERAPIQGVTRPEGLQLSESGTGPLTYVRKEPLFVLSKPTVAECTLRKERADVYGKTFRWAVDVELTEEAEVELLRRFRSLRPKITKWWLVSLNGNLGAAEKTFHQSWNDVPKITVAVFQDRTDAEKLQQFYSRSQEMNPVQADAKSAGETVRSAAKRSSDYAGSYVAAPDKAFLNEKNVKTTPDAFEIDDRPIRWRCWQNRKLRDLRQMLLSNWPSTESSLRSPLYVWIGKPHFALAVPILTILAGAPRRTGQQQQQQE